VTRIVIIGGGPGGYEAALVAAQLGAEVTIVDRDGLGGASVLTDCVPSKTLIATAEVMTGFGSSREELGIVIDHDGDGIGDEVRGIGVDLGKVNRRVKRLALAQSQDITASVTRVGVRVLRGQARLGQTREADGSRRITVTDVDGVAGETRELVADGVLLATGGHPREIPDARPDGERILNWTQVYDLDELPEELIVVGSGVTGAEFAGAYQALGSRVTLVSSRDRVLPGEDPDAAAVLEDVFRRRGMNVLARSRAAAAKRVGNRVEITLTDGRVISGTHCLMAVGAVPNTADMGLEEAGVKLKDSGHVWTDKVSRTTAPGVYAAGDCTGVLALASVAAMQGRIAMYHFLGDAVAPLDLNTVSANIFTDPEIATIGYSQEDVDEGRIDARSVKLPLLRNPRAKMQGVRDGFVKLFCRPGTGIVVGGVVVAPRASELIHPISIAVDNSLTVEQIAKAFTVYPSLSGSIAEAARQLHTRKSSEEQ
jgi:pyruvate/2-oxoglutarate dehydrogenase complex dihydrolipoamide dehydrogenase (E3) component